MDLRTLKFNDTCVFFTGIIKLLVYYIVGAILSILFLPFDL